MEVIGLGGLSEYIIGPIQLELRAWRILALTKFHSIDSILPFHTFLRYHVLNYRLSQKLNLLGYDKFNHLTI